MKTRRSLPWMLLALAAPGCRAPTQIVVDVTTDIPCSTLGGVSLQVGTPGGLEGRAPASTASNCGADGRVGEVVLTPSGDNDAEVAFQLIAGIGQPPDRCAAHTLSDGRIDPGPGCVVKRRELRFLPHETLRVPVQLDASCAGVPCGPSQTCERGLCVSAAVPPDTCATDSGCAIVPHGGSGGTSGSGGQSGAGQAGAGGAAGQGGSGGAGTAGQGGSGGAGTSGQGGAGAAGQGGDAGSAGEGGQGGAGAGGVAGQGGAGSAGEAGAAGQAGAGAGGEAGQSGSSGSAGEAGAAGAAGAAGDGGQGGSAGSAGADAGQGGAGASGASGQGGAAGDAQAGASGAGAGGGGAGGQAGGGASGSGGQGGAGSGGAGAAGQGGASGSGGMAGAAGQVLQVAVGDAHVCVVLVGGAVRCWGDNYHGQLGLGPGAPGKVGDDELPSAVPEVDVGGKALQVAAGYTHTCVLLEGGDVRCWGYGQDGELGNKVTKGIGLTEKASASPLVSLNGKAERISTYGNFTCALLEGGSVRCWGKNDFGQLGVGDTQSLGDNELPTVKPTISLGGQVDRLSTGLNHVCARFPGGDVRCWGQGFLSILGIGSWDDVGNDEKPSTSPLAKIGSPVDAIVTGTSHTCALLPGGQVRCWGSNYAGEIGIGSKMTPAVKTVPTDLPLVNVGATATQLAPGYLFTCVLLSGGGVRCWGSNKAGQCGLGYDENVGDDETPSSVPLVPLKGKAVQLVASGTTACALLDDGSLRCWGANGSGQLGLGTKTAPLDKLGDNETPDAVDPIKFLP